MKQLQIIGDGAFGSFLKELLFPYFDLVNDADSVILAVPVSAYEEVASKNTDKHLINVCSIQKQTTDICLKYSQRVTSIHPLFGRRTPSDKRNSILTHPVVEENDTWSCGHEAEAEFLHQFQFVSKIYDRIPFTDTRITAEIHDKIMAKTHLMAAIGAQQLKVLLERGGNDVPDVLIPHSFRLMKEFVKTLEDMPTGTMDSILANLYG